MNEIEVRFLAINPKELAAKLTKLGAQKISDIMLEEWIFKKSEWASHNGRLRIRKEGEKIEVAYKETTKDTSKGNLEIEFPVDNIDDALLFIEKMGVPLSRHQQKRRIHYIFGNVAIDIDFWPKIPPYVEIEAEDVKTVTRIADKLGFAMKDACELDAFYVYRDVYGIDLNKVTEMVFD